MYFITFNFLSWTWCLVSCIAGAPSRRKMGFSSGANVFFIGGIWRQVVSDWCNGERKGRVGMQHWGQRCHSDKSKPSLQQHCEQMLVALVEARKEDFEAVRVIRGHTTALAVWMENRRHKTKYEWAVRLKRVMMVEYLQVSKLSFLDTGYLDIRLHCGSVCKITENKFFFLRQ